jgi:hypothetical protein
VIAVNFLILAVLAELVSIVLVDRRSSPANEPTDHLNVGVRLPIPIFTTLP